MFKGNIIVLKTFFLKAENILIKILSKKFLFFRDLAIYFKIKM